MGEALLLPRRLCQGALTVPSRDDRGKIMYKCCGV